MYASNSEQAVKMRELARQLRRGATETRDSWYRCQMQIAALDLEAEAEKLDRAGWTPVPRNLH